MDKVKIIARGEGTPEWSLIGATVPGGVIVTTSQDEANAWALIYGNATVLKTRAEYVLAQVQSSKLNQAWLAQQKTIAGR